MGREGGAEAGWHGHIWGQVVITPRVAGQPPWPMNMHRASPGELAVGRPPGRAPYGKCMGLYFIIFSCKSLPKQKKLKKKEKKKGDRKRKLRDRIRQVND